MVHTGGWKETAETGGWKEMVQMGGWKDSAKTGEEREKVHSQDGGGQPSRAYLSGSVGLNEWGSL